jgi:hypothetical protein
MTPRTTISMAALAIAAGLFATTAQAAPMFQIIGGADAADPGNAFNFVTGTGGIIRESAAGNPAQLHVTAAANILIEYIGKEAINANTLFNWGALSGGTLISNSGPGSPTTIGDTLNIWPNSLANLAAPVTVGAAAGMLPFNFFVTVGGNTFENGHAGPSNGDVGFFFADAMGNPLPLNGTSTIAYLLLDDGGGSGDNDHDDMIMRLTLTDAPEPGTLAVLGATLAGLGFARRRRT